MARGGPRPGAGRPKRAEGADAVLYVRLSVVEQAQLDALCVRHRASMADVVRLALAELAKQV